jgi:N-acylglucosamine-6-phosphate 2-epimerase
MNPLERVRGGLIVSCQAPAGHPLHGPEYMAAMSRAAIEGGATGIRAEGSADIRAIRQAVGDVPIVGLTKIDRPMDQVFITCTPEDAAVVVYAGADIVALDATPRPRPGGSSVATIVRRVHELGTLALGDVDSIASAEHALESGVDILATTLAGYTTGPVPGGPDLDLVSRLVALGGAPVVAEGRYSTPDHVREAFARGACAVVVGSAITNPLLTTRRFLQAVPSA